MGRSSTAQNYAISGADEARAYLADPVLGSRLREAAGIVAASTAPSVEHLMGGIDAMKLRSSATLFGEVSGEQVVHAGTAPSHICSIRYNITKMVRPTAPRTRLLQRERSRIAHQNAPTGTSSAVSR